MPDTHAKTDDKPAAKKAKGDTALSYEEEIAKISAAVESLTKAGLGGQFAAHVALQVWQTTSCP